MNRPSHRRTTSLLAAALFATSFAAHAADPAAQNSAAVTVTGTKPLPAEVAYVNTLFGQLDRAKRYPTGREASLTRPSGTATVWVEVARDGHVVGRGVANSSESMLLDDTAVALVGRTRYAPLPADGWTDGPTHRFLVGYRFSSGPSAQDGRVAVAVSGR